MAGQHARFAPSSAEQWTTCLGSVPFIAQCDLPPELLDEHSVNGTIKHDVVRRCLQLEASTIVDATAYAGPVGYSEDEHGHATITYHYVDDDNMESPEHVTTFTEEDALSVHEAVTWIREQSRGNQLFLEQRVDPSMYIGYAESDGTADVFWIDVERSMIVVVDFKGGRGVTVEAVANKQLMLYLLGVMSFLVSTDSAWGAALQNFTFRLVIMQPGALEGTPVKEWMLHYDEVWAWAEYLRQVRQQVDQLNGAMPLTVSEAGCRWCRAKPVCPELATTMLSTAQVHFRPTLDAASMEADIEANTTRSPEALPDDCLLAVFRASPLIRSWLSAVVAHMSDRARAHQRIVGTKLVAGQSKRRWRQGQEEVVLKTLTGGGIKKKDIMEEKLPSPRRVLAVVDALEKSFTPRRRKKLESLIEKPRGRLTLALESDPRPDEMPDAEDMFTRVEMDESGYVPTATQENS